MSLSKDSISNLSKILGISAEDITAKISSDQDEDITIPEGDFFTQDQLSRRDSGKYNEGKEAGQEMLVKDLKKKYSYDFEGKDADSFLSHHENELKNKYSKGSTEKVADLEKDIQKQKEAYEKEINDLKGSYEQTTKLLRDQKVKNQLLGYLPKETTIKSDAIVTLFNSEYEVLDEDGKTYVVKNGEKLKDDKTTEPLALKDVFTNYITQEGFAKPQGGRGGSNEPGNKGNYSNIKSPQDFQDAWKAKNPDKNITSGDFDKDYAEWRTSQKSA